MIVIWSIENFLSSAMGMNIPSSVFPAGSFRSLWLFPAKRNETNETKRNECLLFPAALAISMNEPRSTHHG